MAPERRNENSASQFQGSQADGNRSSGVMQVNESLVNNTSVTTTNHNNHNNHYIQQMMMSNPSLLAQHHGAAQNPILYQNSLLDVANMVPMINPSTAVPSLLPMNNHDSLSNRVAPSTDSNYSTLYNNNSSASTPSPFISTAQQVQLAAAAAAAQAAPSKGYHGLSTTNGILKNNDVASDMADMNDQGGKSSPPNKRTKRSNAASELTEEEKRQLNRDRNRHHARSTRLRKKAYVNKLKELVDGLHAERSEEARKRRVAVQHLAEIQNIRRKVILKFLQNHSGFEKNHKKWETLLEDAFFMKQPLTPFRSFRSYEIEQSKDRDCRICTGLESIICDAASLSVMIENVGSRTSRWQYIKRDEFLYHEDKKTGNKRMPGSIVRESSRLQHAISSLSSSSGSSNCTASISDEDKRRQQLMGSAAKTAGSNNDYHDYHAQPLPDPRLDGESSDCDSPTNASDNAVAGNRVCTDSSSSGDEEKITSKKADVKHSVLPHVEIPSKVQPPNTVVAQGTGMVSTKQDDKSSVAVTDPSVSSNSDRTELVKPMPVRNSLPANIARSGGISHNIRPVDCDINPRLSKAPAIALPPFAGIGKRSIAMNTSNLIHPSTVPSSQVTNFVQIKEPTVVSKETTNNRDAVNKAGTSSSIHQRAIEPDNGASSSDESTLTTIQGNYHVNEDDMLLTENVLMCPFIFRTQDAVVCGALSECIVPGMLRAEFSERNKLKQLEMVFDAMGFMQQLERASGNEGRAHIIPNSLETSLQPNAEEATVITTALPPYPIVSVNELWTRITKYTQMEAEKKELTFLYGKRTDHHAFERPGKPKYDFSSIAKGQAACCTNAYYDKFGREFIAFVSSYPVSNSMNETTHILHIFKELKEKETATEIRFN